MHTHRRTMRWRKDRNQVVQTYLIKLFAGNSQVCVWAVWVWHINIYVRPAFFPVPLGMLLFLVLAFVVCTRVLHECVLLNSMNPCWRACHAMLQTKPLISSDSHAGGGGQHATQRNPSWPQIWSMTLIHTMPVPGSSFSFFGYNTAIFSGGMGCINLFSYPYNIYILQMERCTYSRHDFPAPLTALEALTVVEIRDKKRSACKSDANATWDSKLLNQH